MEGKMTDVLEDVCVYGSDGAQADEENVDGGVAIGSHDVCIFTEGLAIDLGSQGDRRYRRT